MFGQWLSHSHFRIQSSGFEFRHRQLVLNLFLLFAEETETKKTAGMAQYLITKLFVFGFCNGKGKK